MNVVVPSILPPAGLNISSTWVPHRSNSTWFLISSFFVFAIFCFNDLQSIREFDDQEKQFTSFLTCADQRRKSRSFETWYPEVRWRHQQIREKPWDYSSSLKCPDVDSNRGSQDFLCFTGTTTLKLSIMSIKNCLIEAISPGNGLLARSFDWGPLHLLDFLTSCHLANSHKTECYTLRDVSLLNLEFTFPSFCSSCKQHQGEFSTACS